MSKRILVMGSVSVDHTTFTEEMPTPGFTKQAISFLRNIGGKGANQACAAHLLGANVFFMGSIGNDDNGKYISSFLNEKGLKHHLKISDRPTGIASITTNVKTGENQILIVQGANLDITKDDILKLEDEFENSDIFLAQLETSYESVENGLKLAKKHGLITVLNPAPYIPLKEELFKYIDYFIPNEHEMDECIPGNMLYEEKAKILLDKGVKNVIVTLGENGSLLVNKESISKIDAIKVKAVDTTAAGDSYIGALVAGLSKGMSVEEAMVFATKCSAIAVTRKGAISSLPTLEEIS